jgi:hypothetical protein
MGKDGLILGSAQAGDGQGEILAAIRANLSPQILFSSKSWGVRLTGILHF